VGDLRGALKRRLADNPPDTKSKRVAYGALCTRVHYRVVHSAFAANFYYAAAARELFPAAAAGLIPWQDSWWIAVERAGAGVTPFPRFRKTNNLSDPALAYAGPIRDKQAAQRLVESLEDLFDLCRYHHILVQAPQGKACAYKEMGKCPAPCDGSVSLGSYREQMDAALAVVTDRSEAGKEQGVQSLGFMAQSPRAAWREQLEQQMKTAAGKLQFETAGKIKQRLARAGLLDTEPYAGMGRLEDFAFLTLQPGKGKPWIEPWIIDFSGQTPGEKTKHETRNLKLETSIRCLPQFHRKELAGVAEELAGQCRELARQPAAGWLTPEQTRDAALVAHHLFKGESEHSIWLRLAEAQEPGAIVRAVEMLRARKAAKPLAEQSTDAVPQAEDSGEPPASSSV
jgi:excinuclease UvrABC nuclease subunit